MQNGNNYSIDLQHIYSATSPTMAYVLFLEMAVLYKQSNKESSRQEEIDDFIISMTDVLKAPAMREMERNKLM